MYTRYPLIALGIIGIFSLAAYNASANDLSAQDFVIKASISNQFEIASSRLALDKAQNADVKTFARQMVEDHTQAGNKLKETLSSSNSDAKPAEQLDTKHQKLMNKLESASSSDFDRQYVSIQTGS